MATKIAPEELELYWNEKLGTGGGGQVIKGSLLTRETGKKQLVAVKVLDQAQIGDKHEQYLQNELDLLATALSRCASVCKLLGYCIKGKRRCIVLELYECSLAEFMEKHPGGKLPLQQVATIGKQLAEALSRLHEDAHVAHFDVKPDNILMDKHGNCVLADFGIAYHFKDGETHMRLPHDCYGSDRHMSPEQVKDTGRGVSYPADIWGLACTLLHMATGSPPYPELSNTMQVLKALMSGEPPKIPLTLEGRLAGIIRTCLKKAPEARPSARVVRAQLSQLSALLRIESGDAGPSDVDIPAEVLAQADVHPPPSFSSQPSASTASQPDRAVSASTPDRAGSTANASETPASAQEADLLGLMQSLSLFEAASPAPMPPLIDMGATSSSAAATHAPASLDAPQQHHYSSAFSEARVLHNLQPTYQAPQHVGAGHHHHGMPPAYAQPPLASAGLDHPRHPGSNGIGEDAWAGRAMHSGSGSGTQGPVPVVLTACMDGTMGVKCLFRSCNRVLRDTDDKMMGVALLPAFDPQRGCAEAVSVSAGGSLTWWDLDKGQSSMIAPLNSVGRAVAASESMVVVGNENSGLSVWQFQQGCCSSIQAALASGAGPDLAPARVANPKMQVSKMFSSDKVWDLSFEQPWMENPGGSWLAGATSGGCLALWDTNTWQQTFCAYAGSENFRSQGVSASVFSCCAMPGAGMVAVACSGNQLVRVWDCRQQENVAAVMACDVPTDSRADAYIYCVSPVPASGGHVPSQLLFGSNTGRLLLWDLRQPNVLWSLGKLSGRVLGCAASSCGRRIVAGSASGQVGMLDWTKPPVGRLRVPETQDAVALWECNPQEHPMYIFPVGTEKRMVLRAVCGNIVSGRLLSDAFPEAY